MIELAGIKFDDNPLSLEEICKLRVGERVCIHNFGTGWSIDAGLYIGVFKGVNEDNVPRISYKSYDLITLDKSMVGNVMNPFARNIYKELMPNNAKKIIRRKRK